MIQINYFNSSAYQKRWPIIKAALNELCNIKEENKLKIKLVIYNNIINQNNWIEMLVKLKNSNIDVKNIELYNDDYATKISYTNKCETEYFCKWDDDIFISKNVWDFIIENIQILNDESISVLAPTLSNGIPSVELFIKDFLSKEEKSHIHKIFLNENIPNSIWGCNFNEIHNYICNLNSWDGDKYWEFVNNTDVTKDTSSLPWFYNIIKGVHPARFSYTYNKYIANHAINNIDMILNKHNFYFEKYLTPYFCNNLFFSKTSYYKESLTLFNDGWDEGQLTLLAKKTNKVPAYVRNCYGIHMAYGCTINQSELEEIYMKNLFSKI
jgi:hypothetical protein